MVQNNTVSFTASDVTGQKHVAVRDVPVSVSVGEMIDSLLPRMQLQHVDREGQPVHYDARLEREARHLQRSELVGEVLQADDHLTMHPRILAGSPAD
jgi:hypothetical protein